MSSFTFVHAADLHLDTPFQGIAAPAPGIAEALRDASLQAWDDLVEVTVREQAAFLLLAGDIYDGAERGVRAQLRFHRGLVRLAENGIPVFIVHGNHDPVGEGWSAIRSWPSGVTIFPAGDVATVAVERDGHRLATVSGVSFDRRAVTDDLSMRFPRPTDPGFHIAVLHCNAGGDTDHGMYSPCHVADLAAKGYDYWALGHVHKRQTLAEGPAWVAYPGNLQGRSPKPSEMGPKGALLVEVADDQVVGHRFVACDRIRFAPLAIDVAGQSGIDELHAHLQARAAEHRAQSEGRSLLLRVTLDGRGELHDLLRRPQTIADLLRDLRDEAPSGGDGFLWWESLRDHSRPALDRAEIKSRADLSAELLQIADGLRADSASLREFAAKAFEPLSLSRLPETLREISDDELTTVLQAAEDAVLDLRERS
jgi:DNA repair protein SbcD/Mre11